MIIGIFEKPIPMDLLWIFKTSKLSATTYPSPAWNIVHILQSIEISLGCIESDFKESAFRKVINIGNLKYIPAIPLVPDLP
jgi:hypothetical protein